MNVESYATSKEVPKTSNPTCQETETSIGAVNATHIETVNLSSHNGNAPMGMNISETVTISYTDSNQGQTENSVCGENGEGMNCTGTKPATED